MSDRTMRVSYDLEMRDRAKAEGKTLGCIDCDVDGTRFTSKGPRTESEARFLLWCGVMLMKFRDDLPDMKRMVKARERRADKLTAHRA